MAHFRRSLTARFLLQRSIFLPVGLISGVLLFAGPPVHSPTSSDTRVPVPPAQRPVTYERAAVGLHQVANPSPSTTPTLYSIGEPTDEEQHYLELINRARANPVAEAEILRTSQDLNVLHAIEIFSVNLPLMAEQFATLSPTPPLTFHPQLIAAARLHAQDLFLNRMQGHVSSDGRLLHDRIGAQAYPWTRISENVYSYAKSVEHGHAGFEIDWGGDATTGGMQDPPGHRDNIHSSKYHEVGVGVVLGVNGSVGPQVVTQDFATRSGITPFITGVVFHDFNTNRLYDLKEGIEGVTVTVEGASHFAVSSRSGGYAVPVPGDGTFRVTFSGLGITESVHEVSITNESSVKLDRIVSYSSPKISGSQVISAFGRYDYVFTPVAGATEHQWQESLRQDFVFNQGAENGLGGFVTNTTSGYSVITSKVKNSGQFGYQLAHPSAVNQFLSLTNVLIPRSNGEIQFASRLGWASTSQIARLQLSSDGSVSWQDIWVKSGTGSSGQTTFSTERVSLAAYAGRQILLRFAYTIETGSYFPDAGLGVGFYLDDIRLSGVFEAQEKATTSIASGSKFSYIPTAPGNYSLAVRAKVSNRWLPWGTNLLVAVEDSGLTATATIASVSQLSSGGLEITISLAGPPPTFEIQYAETVAGPWLRDEGTTVTNTATGKYQAKVAFGSESARFYRVVTRP